MAFNIKGKRIRASFSDSSIVTRRHLRVPLKSSMRQGPDPLVKIELDSNSSRRQGPDPSVELELMGSGGASRARHVLCLGIMYLQMISFGKEVPL